MNSARSAPLYAVRGFATANVLHLSVERYATRSLTSRGLTMSPTGGIADTGLVRSAISVLAILCSAGGVPAIRTTCVSVSSRSVPSTRVPFRDVDPRTQALRELARKGKKEAEQRAKEAEGKRKIVWGMPETMYGAGDEAGDVEGAEVEAEVEAEAAAAAEAEAAAEEAAAAEEEEAADVSTARPPRLVVVAARRAAAFSAFLLCNGLLVHGSQRCEAGFLASWVKV